MARSSCSWSNPSSPISLTADNDTTRTICWHLLTRMLLVVFFSMRRKMLDCFTRIVSLSSSFFRVHQCVVPGSFYVRLLVVLSCRWRCACFSSPKVCFPRRHSAFTCIKKIQLQIISFPSQFIKHIFIKRRTKRT